MTTFGSFTESHNKAFVESALHERIASVMDEGYIIGGRAQDQHGELVLLNRLDQYRVFPNTWRTRQGLREHGEWEPKFQYPTHNVPAFPLLGKGYVVGVNKPNTRQHEWVFSYDPAENDWQRRAKAKDHSRVHFPGATAGGHGYSFAADIESPRKTRCTRYNPRTDTWIRMKNYSGVWRYRGLAATIGFKIYLYTGETWIGNEQVTRIDQFNAIKNTWKRVHPDVDAAPGSAVGGTVNGHAYFVGGHYKVREPPFVQPIAKGYNPQTNTWERFPSFVNPAVQGAAAFVIEHQNGFYVAGGLEDLKIWPIDRLTSKYDWVKKVWNNRKAHPRPPRFHGEGWALRRP